MRSLLWPSVILGAAFTVLLILVVLTTNKLEVRIVAQSKSTSWYDTECLQQTVQTTQNPNESRQEFCARHDADVATDKEHYGVKDPQPGF